MIRLTKTEKGGIKMEVLEEVGLELHGSVKLPKELENISISELVNYLNSRRFSAKKPWLFMRY